MSPVKYRVAGLLLFVFMSCGGKRSGESKADMPAIKDSLQAQGNTSPVAQAFSFAGRIEKTLTPQDVIEIEKRRDLTNQQILNWLSFLPDIGKLRPKLISFQGETKQVYYLVLGNLLEHDEEENYYDIEQYLVSVDRRTNKTINYLKVQGSETGTVNRVVEGKGLMFRIDVDSKFHNDTIAVETITHFLNPPNSSDLKDVKKEHTISKFIVQPNGEFEALK